LISNQPPLVVVDWQTPCVDDAESVTLEFPAQSSLVCAAWTLNGTPIGPATVNGTTVPQCRPPQPTPTPRRGGHDGRAKKISAAGNVVLSDGTADVKNIVVQVLNEGDHTESIGVYVDIVQPGGITNPFDCTPIGRIIDTVVTLAPGEQTTVNTTQTFNCADVAGALNQSYTIMAAADAHADDGGACGVFQIQSMTCFNALADDDNDSTDNRATTNAFRVK